MCIFFSFTQIKSTFRALQYLLYELYTALVTVMVAWSVVALFAGGEVDEKHVDVCRVNAADA